MGILEVDAHLVCLELAHLVCPELAHLVCLESLPFSSTFVGTFNTYSGSLTQGGRTTYSKYPFF